MSNAAIGLDKALIARTSAYIQAARTAHPGIHPAKSNNLSVEEFLNTPEGDELLAKCAVNSLGFLPGALPGNRQSCQNLQDLLVQEIASSPWYEGGGFLHRVLLPSYSSSTNNQIPERDNFRLNMALYAAKIALLEMEQEKKQS